MTDQEVDRILQGIVKLGRDDAILGQGDDWDKRIALDQGDSGVLFTSDGTSWQIMRVIKPGT